MEKPFTRAEAGAPGEVAAPEPGVRRVTAPNAGPMTFTGTQTYIVGTRDVAVIDPGPADRAHIAAILGALAPGERVARILVTHSHRDHSPGARPLAVETGAEVLGFGPHGAGMSARMRALAAAGGELGGGEGADPVFAPDRTLADGDAVEGPDWRLVALHTPGHLSNHLCFALDATGAVFTGDHVMAWATTMVSPPDGDMAAFLASLERMRGRGDRVFWPGHGGPVREPEAMLAHQLAHRRRREAQILEALGEGPADAAALTRAIYAEVDPRLHGAAARNVFSHLLGLLEAGRVEARGPLSPAVVFALT